MIRCNASLPYFYFTDSSQNILGSICKYGNLHFYTLNKQTDNLFKDAVSKTHLRYFTNANCFDQFSRNGNITGRKIVV